MFMQQFLLLVLDSVAAAVAAGAFLNIFKKLCELTCKHKKNVHLHSTR